MVKNGRQAALMAPTEILAQQHYQGLAPLLENLGIRCALLTGSTTAKTKRSITQQLESGAVSYTHLDVYKRQAEDRAGRGPQGHCRSQ